MLIFLISNLGFAQFKKNNFVICPQLPYSGLHSTYSDDVYNYNIKQNQYFRSTFQYFFNSRLAIGFLFDSFQKNYKVNSNNSSQDKKENSFSFTPEIQFNILNAKFTPYIKVKIGNLNYTKLIFDNPQSSKVYNVYTLSTFKAYENNKSRFLIPTFGLSYLIRFNLLL